jgi:hypothetical protein
MQRPKPASWPTLMVCAWGESLLSLLRLSSKRAISTIVPVRCREYQSSAVRRQAPAGDVDTTFHPKPGNRALITPLVGFESLPDRTLPHFHFVKTVALQNAGDRVSCVVASALQNAILQRGLLQLTLRFFANFAFQIRVWGRE